MAVVINEFEATPQAEPAAQGGGAPKQADPASPKVVREIEKALRKDMERSRRLWAH